MKPTIKKVWLDCDPGHDDMLAIIMAAYSEQIDLIGISTSAGNSYIENTTQNALNILEEIGKNHIKVIQGAVKPLCRPIEVASEIHGKSGLEGAELKFSTKLAVTESPFWNIFKELMKQDGKVHFVVTGAMTNLAILLRAFPQIKQKIQQVTLMGGAVGLGNWSPAAEFNILVDPEAACIVFASGIPIVMIPLEVTHTVLVDESIFQQLSLLTSSFGKKLTPLLRYFQKQYKQHQNFEFGVAHDPCTIYYLLEPSHFTGREAFVEVELEGKSRGRTNCQFYHKKPNSFICEQMKVAFFWKAMIECLKKIV